MSIAISILPTLIEAIKTEINNNADEVAALDQAIGDGDHVANLQRGLNALDAVTDELVQMDWSSALMKIGMTLMSTMGGASGSLFGTLFISMSKASKEQGVSSETIATVFTQGVNAVKQRGKADIGEKTMLDTLIPVAEALTQAHQQGLSITDTVQNVQQAAIKGMESTRDMLATKGRASFLGERARGHIDAGARTSQLMICALADVLNAS